MKKRHQYVIALAILSFIIILPRNCHRYSDNRSYLAQDSVKVAIGIKSNMYSNKGFPIAFNYYLVNQFANDQHTSVQIILSFGKDSIIGLLLDERIDILVLEKDDSISHNLENQLLKSSPVNDFCWLVRKGNYELLDNINYWLGYYQQQKSYSKLSKQYFRSYRINNHLENMTQTDAISPYDNIIKEKSRIIGWDWRLLAAMIFQESRFSMASQSSKGAIGIMQIKQSTAMQYGIDDLFNPENNIEAGVRHLNYLQNLFRSEGIGEDDIIQFTLAAYNAGEGRIEGCMQYALLRGKDFRKWDEVASIIPEMNGEFSSDLNVLQLGRFRGDETIEYVEFVFDKYEEYKSVID